MEENAYNGDTNKNNYCKTEFKAKVVIELMAVQKTSSELSAHCQIAPTTLCQWNKQLNVNLMLIIDEQHQTFPSWRYRKIID